MPTMFGTTQAAWLIAAISAAVLAIVYVMQDYGGYQPCVLCLYQRVPYWLTLGLGLLALALTGRPGLQAALVGLAAVTFLAGATIAGYHLAVEEHWAEGPAACSGVASGLAAQTVEELKTRLLGQPVIRCDEVPWSLFGVSLAGYNVAGSLVMAIGTLVVLGRRRLR
jgi:disulfide bond formation protein DsbB